MVQHVVGRQAEEQALCEFFDAVPREPRALVLEGEAGIGKTTLWLDALGRARQRDFHTLSCRASSTESVLAYSMLADLLSEIDESVWAHLPEPQQQALDGALLRRRLDGEDIDPRAVAAAFLAVISHLTADRPVLIAIDDLQWVDASSANAVSFAARRLPVGAALLCTTRTEAPGPQLRLPKLDDVQRVRLQPLTIAELRQVLLVRLGTSLPRPTLLRLHQISDGNPLFALELARDMGPAFDGSAAGVPHSLDEVVSGRIRRVSTGAEEALLAMASLPDPTTSVVAQAARITPDSLAESLSEAEAQRVVVLDGHRLRFTHPILSHGVYSGAPPHRRRDMHRRLAGLVQDPELKARHLALSSTTAEPATVAALDQAADIARRRGAPAAAAELLELAIKLGANDPLRRIRCATDHFDASNSGLARQMLEAVLQEVPQGAPRAEALLRLGLTRLYDDSFPEAAEILASALHDVDLDPGMRVRIRVSLSYALLNAGQIDQAYEHVQRAVTDADGLGLAALVSQALGMRTMIDFMVGRGIDQPALERAVTAGGHDRRTPVAFRPHVQLILLRAWTGELNAGRDALAALHHQCVTSGEESELIFIGFHRTLVDIWLGDLDSAAGIAEETMERATQLGGDLPLFIALTLRAAVASHAGRFDEARRDLNDATAAAQRCGSRRLAEWPATLAGFIGVSCGDYHEALKALEPLLPMVHMFPDASEVITSSFVPEAVEAMIGLSRFDDAEPLIEALERNGRRLDRAWTLAVGARCRAMLQAARGELAAATTTAEFALTEHERLPMPFERARTQLLLGRLQRRQRHRDTAIATLEVALQTFQQVGTTAWSERAQAELARCLSGKRPSTSLTPTEKRVADLALSGMTNQDIAAALFISPKTVEVNLTRVYRKLKIRSRMELHRVLRPDIEIRYK
jgi:DNA-binding CsgD family transcriptional regulator